MLPTSAAGKIMKTDLRRRIRGHLRQRRFATTGHGDHVITELLRIGLGHDDILPSKAEASHIGCQPNPVQTLPFGSETLWCQSEFVIRTRF
ncbi:hypothetical protein FHU35_12392 [Saccharopolyspora dendranthemae]|uniref:Uncharacterized protein n=1 Tax=Saccharopolyspora dendranthemae TaxID=1181886 RepID=A0A561U7R2_9PSEU|nr:hypothetical protein FHU35_12392 [Saccharopolyspora dendranthemae]